MTADRRSRRSVAALAAVGVTLLSAVALGVWRPWAPVATPQAAGGAETAAVQPAPILLADDPTVLIFGDSWTYGSAATDPEGGYAYLVGESLGWDTIVDGVRSSGYLKPGIDGPDYGDRIAALDPALDPDLVILQGSINDRRQDLSRYADAVNGAWDALVELYPDAAVVVLGPAPQVLPVEETTARIDAELAALASTRGWWYISPVSEEWITEADYDWVIDTSETGTNHPGDAGHAYLAGRLADAIAHIAQPFRVEAAEQQPVPDVDESTPSR
ncbi:SGNH/GDSL hydrolase family protein [Microbacterium betulae]|uniref:SGNH/GDSL hydrolase family protein n=1 Tax=Microbacterium betulae TaxID=2981139 RepID=A0AA97FIH0_9MICO|nr:SGNH/GDSL hydrolase family protein [Microbacterium sp. AB]WOF22132.1 SGNH/GDSL hydrolase family protein [Microbacterium sp. AB]